MSGCSTGVCSICKSPSARRFSLPADLAVERVAAFVQMSYTDEPGLIIAGSKNTTQWVSGNMLSGSVPLTVMYAPVRSPNATIFAWSAAVDTSLPYRIWSSTPCT